MWKKLWKSLRNLIIIFILDWLKKVLCKVGINKKKGDKKDG